MTDSIIVDGLSKRFKNLEAVRDVSFSVKEGEVFGFLGPNGAGKTTTINVLCTLLKPSGGSAQVAGFDVVRQQTQVRRSIGLVFQDTTLDEYLTAEQNLRFHAYAYGVSRKLTNYRIEELLKLLELWDRRKQSIREYSGGMKRRLELARGLLHHPRVLFLDEPSLGLDPQARHKIWEYVLDLHRNDDTTIFMTTHYMDEAEHCDRIAVIDNGGIIALGTPEELKRKVGGDVITLKSNDKESIQKELREKYSIESELKDDAITFTVSEGDKFLPEFVRASTQPMQSISIRRPTLDDVFLKLTGHAIRDEAADAQVNLRGGKWGSRRR
ncbi:MAG: ATP-binding cassette domain-containing protein [Chloroflexi bacterium]|nr:ATP-binding cassette domain-containing protein [Chloroflexota bacterium]